MMFISKKTNKKDSLAILGNIKIRRIDNCEINIIS